MSLPTPSEAITEATRILESLQNMEIVLKIQNSTDEKFSINLANYLSDYQRNNLNNIMMSEGTAFSIIADYNHALTRGMVQFNNSSQEKLQEENKNLKEEIIELKKQNENEKALRYKSEGRLEEYRRRYEGGEPSFTSEVTEDESS